MSENEQKALFYHTAMTYLVKHYDKMVLPSYARLKSKLLHLGVLQIDET